MNVYRVKLTYHSSQKIRIVFLLKSVLFVGKLFVKTHSVLSFVTLKVHLTTPLIMVTEDFIISLNCSTGGSELVLNVSHILFMHFNVTFDK